LKTGAGGSEIFDFTYEKGKGWPVPPRKGGHSLVPLTVNGQATGALDYPGNWRASSFVGGSPGATDPAPPSSSVILNEVTAHTDYSNPQKPEYDSNDWIELLNTTDQPISLDSWYLSDTPANIRKWRFPPMTVPARGRLTLDEVSNFHVPITNGFGIDKAGEQLLLSFLPADSRDRVADYVEFDGQENDRSYGRYPDAAIFWGTMLPSSNIVNSAPMSGLVISEVMYHPPNLATNDNTRDEFVEVHNAGTLSVTFQDTNGVWRLGGGVGFIFPIGFTLPPAGVALLVNFDLRFRGASDLPIGLQHHGHRPTHSRPALRQAFEP
jgi:hypothetical protein